jgi:predicted HicB family RNase H-like nuclease
LLVSSHLNTTFDDSSLAIEAMQVGLSLNALVAQKLAAAVLSVHAI